MATKKSQRIGIWVITIALTVGTVAGFIAMMIAPGNQKIDDDHAKTLMAEYQKEYASYQKEVDAQQTTLDKEAPQLAKQYGAVLKDQKSAVDTFDEASVSGLVKKDSTVGTGETLTKNDTFAVYYIGWTPDGKIFDSSFEGKTLKSPIIVRSGGVIQGWTDGLDGVKAGGVRMLTIPAELAYGEKGQGSTIAPNTPLKFVVVVVKKLKTIQQPQPSQELLDKYGQ